MPAIMVTEKLKMALSYLKQDGQSYCDFITTLLPEEYREMTSVRYNFHLIKVGEKRDYKTKVTQTTTGTWRINAIMAYHRFRKKYPERDYKMYHLDGIMRVERIK